MQLAVDSTGYHSLAARLAAALLGDLLYEKGEIEEAERLLDESCELGSESGVVDFMIATYATGSCVKEFAAFLKRPRGLDEGTRVAVALSLPRLESRLEGERIRLGLPTTGTVASESATGAGSSRDSAQYPDRPDGIRQVIRENRELNAIRRTLTEGSRESAYEACVRAKELTEELERHERPRASLLANLVLVSCLSSAGRTKPNRSSAQLPRNALSAGSSVLCSTKGRPFCPRSRTSTTSSDEDGGRRSGRQSRAHSLRDCSRFDLHPVMRGLP